MDESITNDSILFKAIPFIKKYIGVDINMNNGWTDNL